MPISKEEVARIAELAGLKLSPEELDTHTVDLARIIDYFERLSTIDTSEISPRQASADTAALRDDVVCPSLSAEEALKNAPETEDNYIIVPRVI
jgi:aspartyl-tRNA(Asn)/glutamyl-tRNA(Gln) amidotransferase subunit C